MNERMPGGGEATPETIKRFVAVVRRLSDSQLSHGNFLSTGEDFDIQIGDLDSREKSNLLLSLILHVKHEGTMHVIDDYRVYANGAIERLREITDDSEPFLAGQHHADQSKAADESMQRQAGETKVAEEELASLVAELERIAGGE